MKKALWTSTLREIKGSFGRYVAILAIVALGVGFYAGLSVSQNAMIETGDEYFRENGMHDLRLISTLGLKESDVDAIKALPFVREAEGAYSADALVTVGDTGTAVKFISLSDRINVPVVTKGRAPQSPDECMLDAFVASEAAIGSKVVLTDSNKEGTLDLFARREFTVVGICQSVLYVNYERGATSIGDGTLSGFICVLPEAFDSEYYTEAYAITDASDHRIYSDEYNDLMDRYEDESKALIEKLAKDRYDELYTEGSDKIKEAEDEIADAEDKLADGKKKIADAEQDIADAEQEIADHEAEIADAEQKIADGEREIADAEQKIRDSEREIANGEKELSDSQAEIEANKQKLTEARAQIDGAMAAMGLPEAYFADKIAEIEAGWNAVHAGEAEIEKARKELESGKAEIRKGKKEIEEHKKEIEDATAEILDGKKKIEDGKKDIEEGKREIADKKAEIADAEVEIADGKEKLSDAKEEFEKLKEPDTYAFTREMNVGYVCFENDTGIVEGVSKVFPVFFFLVAALVCMTTMNRMIEEQRTQVGVMKALGYSESSIMGKYLFYSGSAALIGGVSGFIGGTVLIPQVVWMAYAIMYSMKQVRFVFDIKLALISLVVSILCSMGATYFTLRGELKSQAADLIRPKAPANGKRVLLERIGFIWKRMSFTGKVSVRNVFRYKKRFFMMVLGVGGCYALLVTGMGLKDSIVGITDNQFKKIQNIDITVSFKDGVNESELEDYRDVLTKDELSILAKVKSVDVIFDGRFKNATLSVYSDEDPSVTGADFMNFMDEKENPIDLPGFNEVIISGRMAKELGISIGDEVILRDSDLKEMKAKVSAIMLNYVNNLAFVSKDTFVSQSEEEYAVNTAYVRTTQDVYALGAKLSDLDGVTSVSITQDMVKRVDNMLKSMDYIVWLTIVSAAALAFIVMYNLTNINITERIREIATLKVLGFYSAETNIYVFRENFALTAIGIVAGFFMGKALHAYVMYNVKVEMVSFDTKILPQSFLIAIVLTFLYAILVDVALSFKLERIKMAESLKSVE